MRRKNVLHFLRGYLLLVVCLLCLTVPFYMHSFRLLESRQLDLMRSTLESGVLRLDQQIVSLDNIAFSLSGDSDLLKISRFEPGKMTASDYYHLSRTRGKLQKQFIGQPYAADYGILFRNGIVLTRDRVHFPDEDFYGKFLRFGELERDEFLSLFRTRSSVISLLPQIEVHNGDSSYQAVLWLCELTSVHVKNPSAVAYAAIPVDQLRSLLMSDLGVGQTEAGFTLYARDGEMLAACGLRNTGSSDCRTLSAAGDSSGLRAEMAVSERLFSDMMAPVRRMLYLGFGILLLAGIVLSALIALRASTPLNRLLNLIDEVQPESEEKHADSYERISSAVTTLATSVGEYREALEQQNLSVREHIFSEMLHETPVQGSLVSAHLVSDFKNCFPDFPAKYRLALAVLPRESIRDLPEHQLAVLGLVKSIYEPVPEVFFRGRYCILILTGEQQEGLRELKRQALEKAGLTLTAALSGEAESFEKLHTLYQDTRRVISLAEAEKDPGLIEVWQKENFPNLENTESASFESMIQLYQMLSRGDEAGVMSVLSQLCSGMIRTSGDASLQQQGFYGIRAVLCRVRDEKSDVLSGLVIPDYHAELDVLLMNEALASCCREICAKLAPLAARPQAVFASSVISYIEEHLSDSMLGVGMVAEHFAVSEPTLQKVIRQEKNATFQEYVDGLRFAHAVTLLESTPLTIAAVASACGYNSLNSFYKAFKRQTAETPAAMRQRLQAEKAAGNK